MKIALITGASSGIGREYARQIDKMKECDEIWVVARREDRLNALKEELSDYQSTAVRPYRRRAARRAYRGGQELGRRG